MGSLFLLSYLIKSLQVGKPTQKNRGTLFINCFIAFVSIILPRYYRYLAIVLVFMQHRLRNKVSRLTFITYSWTKPCSYVAGTWGYHQSLTKCSHRALRSAWTKPTTSSHLSPILKKHPTGFASCARQELLPKADWYRWPPTFCTAQQSCPINPLQGGLNSLSQQTPLNFLHGFTATRLLQKGHFKLLATFAAPRRMTRVSARSPQHSAHVGSQQAKHSPGQSAEAPPPSHE